MSEGRKIYPITDEILERGEKVFWEEFERLTKERSEKRNQEDNSDENDIKK